MDFSIPWFIIIVIIILLLYILYKSHNISEIDCISVIRWSKYYHVYE
jgi:hypothetical protein